MTPSRLIPRLLLHRLPPPTTRTIPTPTPIHPLQNHFAHHYSTTNPIPRPRIAQSSFWSPIIPKFLRNRRSKDPNSNSEKPKEWNPASFYIIIFILIGSQAIRMLALKHEYAAYMRTTNAKIATLKEVIERVQRGEAVDVAKMLGTGDQAKEREWEDVLRELEEEDSLWHEKAAKKSRKENKNPETEANQSKDKDPVVPAEGDAKDQTPKTSQGARKLNFF